MSKAISMNQIANFQADLDQRPEAKVIERSVTKNGILASSQDIQAMSQTTPVFPLIWIQVTLLTKSKVVVAGCSPL